MINAETRCGRTALCGVGECRMRWLLLLLMLGGERRKANLVFLELGLQSIRERALERVFIFERRDLAQVFCFGIEFVRVTVQRVWHQSVLLLAPNVLWAFHAEITVDALMKQAKQKTIKFCGA